LLIAALECAEVLNSVPRDRTLGSQGSGPAVRLVRTDVNTFDSKSFGLLWSGGFLDCQHCHATYEVSLEELPCRVGFYRPLWIAACAINSGFSYFWDVERDWEISWFTNTRGAGPESALHASTAQEWRRL
jgi:EXS family